MKTKAKPQSHPDEPSTPVERRAQQLRQLEEEIDALSRKDDPTAEDEARLDALIADDGEYRQLRAAVEKDRERAKVLEEIRGKRAASERGHDAPNQINRDNPFSVTLDLRSASREDVRSAALRAAEARGRRLNKRQQEHLQRLIGDEEDASGQVIAERLLLTENAEYRAAFLKLTTRQHPILTQDEADAVLRFQEWERRHEMRAANEGTGSAGGYGIPVLIDPTIILTSGAADAPILDISRVITITTNQWKGVSSQGMTWSYYAEASVVADNTPTLAQPTIPVFSARGFLPYSLEVEQDYPGFEAEMAKIIAQGYVNMLAVKTMQGSGVNEPTGIFTAMSSAGTPPHVVVTTAGTLGAVDVRKAWAALPERFRPNAKWVMNVTTENLIRAWGNNLALSDYTINMTADGEQLLMGRQVIDSDYAPAFSGQTQTFNYLVVGDFQHFIIVQRAGMTIEQVPHLFDPTTGRPIGERGWFAWARHGFAPDDFNPFRIVTNS